MLVNVVDVPPLCNFIMPAIVRTGPARDRDLDRGASPALAKRMKREIAELYGEPYAQLAEILNDIRGWAKETLPTYQDRKDFFEAIVNGDARPHRASARGRRAGRARSSSPPKSGRLRRWLRSGAVRGVGEEGLGVSLPSLGFSPLSAPSLAECAAAKIRTPLVRETPNPSPRTAPPLPRALPLPRVRSFHGTGELARDGKLPRDGSFPVGCPPPRERSFPLRGSFGTSGVTKEPRNVGRRGLRCCVVPLGRYVSRRNHGMGRELSFLGSFGKPSASVPWEPWEVQ